MSDWRVRSAAAVRAAHKWRANVERLPIPKKGGPNDSFFGCALGDAARRSISSERKRLLLTVAPDQHVLVCAGKPDKLTRAHGSEFKAQRPYCHDRTTVSASFLVSVSPDRSRHCSLGGLF